MDIKIICFKTEYQTGRQPYDMVQYFARGAVDESGRPSATTWARISHITPPTFIDNDESGIKIGYMRAFWAQIEGAYLKWKSNEELPVDGTPLGAWPGVNPDQAEALRGAGLTSVEAVAAVSEDMLSRPPLPNMRDIKRQAQLWMDGRGDAATLVRMAELEAQNAAMLEMLAEQSEDKPKRGRPRKVEEDDAA